MNSDSNQQVHLRLVWNHPRNIFFDQVIRRMRISFRNESHREIFRSRSYKTTSDLEMALRRYKVFGDLGY